MLALSRITALAPGLRRVGLSATVGDPPALAGSWPHPDPCAILRADRPRPEHRHAAHPGRGAAGWWRRALRHRRRAGPSQAAQNDAHLPQHRAQAELFYDLWLANVNALPIGIHHGSLARDQREKVEAAMANGQLRAVVCRIARSASTGATWIVIRSERQERQRLVQRIGRANHRYNTIRALLVPANRFEIVECGPVCRAGP